MKYPRIVYFIQNITRPFGDPIKFMKAFPGIFKYSRDLVRYLNMEGSEKMNWLDLIPKLEDNTKNLEFDSHYFYQHIWAFKKILASGVSEHYDCGSHREFTGMLSAITKVNYIELRAMKVNVENFAFIQGDILKLPFKNDFIKSFSCLHVLEHVGLGRYGDKLNPQGTKEACQEIKRVLAPGGNLYISLPIGRPRLCFNGQRTHSPQQIVEYMKGLKLMEFAGVDDNGVFKENRSLERLANERQGCGFFWFKK